jgi:hypothetical protein
MGDWNEGVTVTAFGRGHLEDDTVDVRRVGCVGDGKLADVADGTSLGVDYGGPHECGDARPLIGML